MNEGRSRLPYPVMKWALFAALFLVAPAPVIVQHSFMTGPVVFLGATVITMIADSFTPDSVMNRTIIGYFVVHLTLYSILYFVISMLCSMFLISFKRFAARGAALSTIVIGIVSLAVFPLYGGAGIYRGRWMNLAAFFEATNNGVLGPRAALSIYGPVFACVAGYVIYRTIRRKRSQAIDNGP